MLLTQELSTVVTSLAEGECVEADANSYGVTLHQL
jgi:hypothetical protein